MLLAFPGSNFTEVRLLKVIFFASSGEIGKVFFRAVRMNQVDWGCHRVLVSSSERIFLFLGPFLAVPVISATCYTLLFIFSPLPSPPLRGWRCRSTRVVVVTPHCAVVEVQVVLLLATVSQTVVISDNPVEILWIFTKGTLEL